MATRGKKTRKSAGAGKKKKGATKARSSGRSASAKRAKKSASSRAKRPAAKRRAPVKKAAPVKKVAPVKAVTGNSSPISRVTRVAKEVAHQATTAVSEGVDALKEFGGNIVERVTG
jgi:hypothetical protein